MGGVAGVVGERIMAKGVSVHVGAEGELHKDEHASIQVELDGIVGDRHRSYERSAFEGDKQPKGTVRRNERQWSAVSVEELAEMQATMDLSEPLTATFLGANLCISGVAELSRLPKSTMLRFPSGAALVVEEFNPPCHYMSKKVASLHTTNSGEPLSSTAFSKASKLTRGVVGAVEVAGAISAGYALTVDIYYAPHWLHRAAALR